MDACFVDVTVELLAVAFHNILYHTCVYPKSSFVERKKYGIVVYRCTHPSVIEYLENTCRRIREALEAHELYRVEYAITDQNQQPVGIKFVFDFERMEGIDDDSDAYLIRLEHDLRAFLLQLGTLGVRFHESPEDGSFAILLYASENFESVVATNYQLIDFPYIEDETVGDVEDMNIKPIRRFIIKNYLLLTYIELPKPWAFYS